MESSKEGFNRIRNELMKVFNLERNYITIYYYIMKYRPKVISAIFTILNRFSYLTRKEKLKKKVKTTGQKHMTHIPNKDESSRKSILLDLKL